MPGYARKEIVQEGQIGVYHTWSRCVQRAFLCGYDPVEKIDYDYRRGWIKSLLAYQASVFAVDVGNYSILSNHQHLIARTRPDIAACWSDEQVAWRWKLAWPTWIDGQWVREPTDQEIEELLAKPERIPILRNCLSSLSWFMARWKEPIARMANAERDRRGHFYEQRFGSRELEDDAGHLTCNIYLDLNQIKAGMAKTLEESHYSAIQDRLKAWRHEQAIASVETFHASEAAGYSLEVGDVEELLVDCFLAPIGDQGPPLLANDPGLTNIRSRSTAESAPLIVSVPTDYEPNGEAVGDSACESKGVETNEPIQPAPVVEHPEPTEIPATEPNSAASTASDSAAAQPSESKGVRKRRSRTPTRPTPTRKIHQRLQSGRRKRASDNVYLGIPRHQYLAIVRWTAEQFLAPSTDESKPPPPPDTVSEILRHWGIAPNFWCELIDKFASWFHRAVGHADQLVTPNPQSKRKWVHGIRRCRQVFT